MNVKDCKIGMKVRFIGRKNNEIFCSYYPEVGTIGRILEISTQGLILVEWPEGSTVAKFLDNSCTWYVTDNMIEPLALSKKEEIADKENLPIWEMLKPKMAKNQFIHNGEYISEEVKKMVELAYTCGYRRAKKGKPFMYVKKNKGENQ